MISFRKGCRIELVRDGEVVKSLKIREEITILSAATRVAGGRHGGPDRFLVRSRGGITWHVFRLGGPDESYVKIGKSNSKDAAMMIAMIG